MMKSRTVATVNSPKADTQIDRFKQAARDLECGEGERDERLRNVAKRKPTGGAKE